MISELFPSLAIPLTLLYSRCALQVDWFSADHEEQCVQSHCRAQVPSSHHVSTATVGYEERRFLGKLTLADALSLNCEKDYVGRGMEHFVLTVWIFPSLHISTLPLHQLLMTL